MLTTPRSKQNIVIRTRWSRFCCEYLTRKRMTTETANYGKVTILLSTYNGSRFLRQQLDSLYQQTYPRIQILVRDDASVDSTRSILQKEQTSGRIQLFEGDSNLGAAPSFFMLLKIAAQTRTEFVAFCDQDDVWHPDKISRAVSMLADRAADGPALYCSSVEIVNAHLEHIGYTMSPRKIGFGNALVDCVTTGCTIVLNHAALHLLSENLPGKVVMHDWWCYLVISCFGDIVYDPTATLKYRQHEGNTIGLATNPVSQLIKRCHRFFGSNNDYLGMSMQASWLDKIFKDRIPISNRQSLHNFIAAKSSLHTRLQLVFSRKIWRQKWLDNLLLRLLILLNRY